MVHSLGRQVISFRGHRENEKEHSNNNLGNYIGILQNIAHYYSDFKEHIKSSVKNNATYLNQQNGMIELIVQ